MKRVTLFCGHYGSGKTQLAIQFAKNLKKDGFPAALADMDIVNPYFRSADAEAELQQAGIEVVRLPYANTNVDLPALPQELYGLMQRRNIFPVLDVGGDDRGAYALGRYAPYLLEENDFDLLYVVNFYRPLTRTMKDALGILYEIQDAAGLPFTGIVHNSNLGAETRTKDIEAMEENALALSRESGLPLVMTAYRRDLPPPDCVHPFPVTIRPSVF